MPPDDTAVPVSLPQPSPAGSDKIPGQGPAGAAPEDVQHWFDLETIVELPAPVASFADAADAAAQYRRASRSENTPRLPLGRRPLYGLVRGHGQTAMPASPETVAAFLAAEARTNLAVNTLRLRHAAIRYLHLLAGYPPPTAAAVVATTLAGIKRAHRRPLNKKTALVLDRLRAAVQTIPETLPGWRDRALLLVGFAAALRPSELAAVTFEQLARHADGIELFLPGARTTKTRAAPNSGCRRAAPSSVRSPHSKPGSPPRRSPKSRCSGGSGSCRRRACQRAPGASRRRRATASVAIRSTPMRSR
jgi:integrase